MDVAAAVREFGETFDELGTAERAIHEKKYLKSALRFHGVTVPQVRAAAKRFYRANPELRRDDVLALVDGLWGDWHNFRSLAIALLGHYADRLQAKDVRLLESLLEQSNSWDHVDWICTGPAAVLVARSAGARKRLERWARHESFWLRRASMLTLMKELARGEGDFDVFAARAASMLHEKEFFIRKVIGWVLRDVGKKQPQWTIPFIEAHAAEMSGLTFREATRRLPEEQQARLLTIREG